MAVSGGRRGAVLLAITIGAFFWWGMSRRVDNPLLFPTPQQTFRELAALAFNADFQLDLLATLERLAASLFLNLTAAAALTLAALRFPFLARMLTVPVSLMRSLPIMAIILLALIWLDSRYTVILVTSLMIFPILYLGLLEGACNVGLNYREVARLYRIPMLRRLTRVYLPAIASHFYTALATAAGLGFKVTVSAEIYSQPQRAVGTLFQKAWAALNTPKLFALSLIIVTLAGIVNFLINRLCRINRYVV